MKDKESSGELTNVIITIMLAGDEVANGTEKCILWKQRHSKCCGCSSELGCNKYLALLFMIHGQKPKEMFPAFLSRILGAKTIEEVDEAGKELDLF
jgi:hypothetical protein